MNHLTWIVTLAACSGVATTSHVLAQAEVHATALESSSDCFHVRSVDGGPGAADLLELCESLRTELRRVWGLADDRGSWQPRCEVIVHASLASYLSAAGPGAAQTKGSSLIEFRSGQISRRRIDLRVEPDGTVSALPHELTHVVLADRFGGRQPPHWLDEGIAMLADTRDKQMLHARDCRDALASGNSLPLTQLLHLNGFSAPNQMPAFYGQSLSLVQMLAHRDKPQRVIDFAVDSMNHGYARALQAHYGISSIPELESRWRAFAAAQVHSPSPSLMTVRFQP